MQPIVNRFRAYDSFPYEAVAPSVLELLRASTDTSANGQRRTRDVLKTVECVLQLTRQTVTVSDLAEGRLNHLYRLVMGAVNSDRFIRRGLEWRVTLSGDVTKAFLRLDKVNTGTPLAPIESIRREAERVRACTDEFDNFRFDDRALWLWKGWAVSTKTGETQYLPLYPLVRRLGRDFVSRFYEVCLQCAARRIGCALKGVTVLCHFIGAYPGELDPEFLLDKNFVTQFWRDFFDFYATRRYRNGDGPRISTIVTEWRKEFTQFVLRLEQSGLFASPCGAFPTAPPNYTPSHRTNVLVGDNGTETHTKLLTHIPLQATDEEAMGLLFHKIRHDLDTIVSWAERCASETWQNFENRSAFASRGRAGFVSPVEPRKGKTGPYSQSPTKIYDACATFEKFGFVPRCDRRQGTSKYKYGRGSAAEVAASLALPTAYSLLPHCVILVAEHPAITGSFLESLELFDRDGRLSGFVEIDGIHYLVGHKKRRGPGLARQQIALSKRSTQIVRQIVAVTQCLRDYLRKRNDDSWRMLLLECGKGSRYPRKARDLTEGCGRHRQEKLAKSIALHAAVDEEDARSLASRLSLAAVRASAGVLVYLRTRSVEEMASALGHAAYHPRTMASYLPSAIQSFFQERWIRIFQDSLLVEALKDSEFILEATSFKTMKELDGFLTTHALRLRLPKIKVPAPNSHNTTVESEVIFGVNRGILTALLSIQLAVKALDARPCATAQYWSAICERLVGHIENRLSARADLTQYLADARTMASAHYVKDLIIG